MDAVHIKIKVCYRCVMNVSSPNAGEEEEEDMCEVVNRYHKK